MLLQIEATSDATQQCRETRFALGASATDLVIAGEGGIGSRRWIKVDRLFECQYETKVEVTRLGVPMKKLRETPRMQIPAEVIQYLMPSRYCHSELFLDFVSNQFADLTGGVLIAAMASWITKNFTYDSNASFMGATATDSFASQAGVCRDYAHVLISFSRVAGIPARFVSVYAPDVIPQDFHAVAEVYLEGDWHIVDPTGMANPQDMARISVGRDAADTSFLTSYGWISLREQSVEVKRISA